MSLGGPNIYPSSGVWIGVARELSPGTPLIPVITHPRMTKEELTDKIEWEGGVIDAVEYGINAEEFPEDAPVEVTEAWRRLQKAIADAEIIYKWLEEE